MSHDAFSPFVVRSTRGDIEAFPAARWLSARERSLPWVCRSRRSLGYGTSCGQGPSGPHLPNTERFRSSRTTAVPVRNSRLLRFSGEARDSFGLAFEVEEECYLVDPASSHMLVSKIKPCMCKYELIQTVKLRMAH